MSIQKILEKTTGPCIVLAGAGTGKTHTIVEKIRYLISNKVYPSEKIVCITFSNEAAINVQSRVQKAVQIEVGKEPIIKTFHAFAADLLRKHGSKIGIKEDFAILTPDDAKVLVHRTLRTPAGLCHKYIHTLSMAKDLGVSIEELRNYLAGKLKDRSNEELATRVEQLQFQLQTMHLQKDKQYTSLVFTEVKKEKALLDIRKFIVVWEAYEKIKQKHGYLDYADLNAYALVLLEKHPELADAFAYIIVDEFQDTNKVQLDFLKAVCPSGNSMVVGDVNQSIYRFRGAYKDNLQLFKRNFAVSKESIFNLATSYRSPNKVLRNAHRLIERNYENKEECFLVNNYEKREGQELEVYELQSGKEEARKVVELVGRERQAGVLAEEICVMFRTHQQGILIRRALEQAGIAYSAVTKSNLLKHPAIKTVLDYLTIAHLLHKELPGGEQAWWDLLYQLDFLPEDLIALGKFIKQALEEKKEPLTKKMMSSAETLSLSISGKRGMHVVIERLQALQAVLDKPITELLLEVYRITGLVTSSDELMPAHEEIEAHLHKLLELAQQHSSMYGPDVSSFLHYLDIVTALGIEFEAAGLEKTGVRLMTLHATKGLEYRTVIITNMAQKRFPLERIQAYTLLPAELLPELAHLKNIHEDERDDAIAAFEKHHQLLEERRLCYVAFTRAKEKLILMYALEYAGKPFFASQFLEEINYKENPDVHYIQDKEEKAVPASNEPGRLTFASLLRTKEFDALLQKEIAQASPPPEQRSRVFSPSALLLFAGCQKEYEYKYVYHMPERKTISWEALRLGSFVHAVLEHGVVNGFHSSKEFEDYARELHLHEEWQSVELADALAMIKVFYERNRHKYSEKSKTEQELRATLGGFQFTGFADRIDTTSGGLEIIDYKTGKSFISPQHRNWQLGYYALAAGQLGLGKVKAVTLDMLKQDKPLEFHIDTAGSARAVDGRMAFNVYEVEQELIETARQITNAFTKGFQACPPEKNCAFCTEYVYGS